MNFHFPLRNNSKISNKTTIAIIVIALLIIYWQNYPTRVIDVTVINNKQVILFKKTCKFESIYLTTENGKDISEAIFSKIPGEGVIFRKNTYIKFEKLLNYNPEDNKTYELSSITECGEYPIYRKFLKFKKSGNEFEIIKFN
ncbi:hypothetical protein [Vogesella sp. LIG4]|uniref:hypothetical protein n=1 Tax=Vogesella sp. LIG4 TaxID=1192162 RepID=UPI0012FE00C0|nr:hypothetical protein [Vogesella sp. LIG4]